MAKALYTCEGTIGFSNQKTDIMGLFNAITPPGYPYVHPQFVAFAQLSGGLGRVAYYFDLRFAATGHLIHTTTPGLLSFAHRDQIIQLAYTIPGCPFPRPGLYLVELFCNAHWLADTKLSLL
jgi:hypothetical protein